MEKNIDLIKGRLTPFDVETILMIKSVTGHEPEITEKAESFELKMYVKDKDEYIIKAAIDAVIGRYGLRMRAVKHIWEQMFLRGATFFVEYEKGAENLPDDMMEIIDELADVNAVLFHIAALFGYSQKELLEMAYTKIASREKTPEFMRKHPHKEPESPVCGNCSNFENEDAEGGGFCNEQNRMRHCSCIACNQWQERQTAEEYKQFEKRFNAIQ